MDAKECERPTSGMDEATRTAVTYLSDDDQLTPAEMAELEEDAEAFSWSSRPTTSVRCC